MMSIKRVLGTISLLAWCFEADALVPQIQRSHQTINQHHDILTLHSRRDALRNAFLLTPLAIATTILLPSDPANALEQCKPKSHNCIRTAWTAPSNLSSTEVVNTIREVLNSYPQAGQAGVDCSGWKIVKDTLDDDADDAKAGIITLEYKSCIGPAALAINLGQPFIDDLKLELGKDSSTGSIAVEVKSSSRMGSGDLFVNRKRLEYLGKKLKEKGWGVPKPLYVYEK